MKIVKKSVCLITALCMALTLTACAGTASEEGSAEQTASTMSQTENGAKTETTDGSAGMSGSLSKEGYTLKQVVVLSRHNIRSPLSGEGSELDTLTSHDWYEWSSDPSELSLRGGVLETEMGQYFRTWLESEEFFPKNYQPGKKAVRIYSNSKQRTIATARYFSAGLLPTADTDAEYHVEFDTMDPVFTPQLTFVSEEYRKDTERQIEDLYAKTIDSLSDNYDLLEDVIDIKDSEAWEDGTVTDFSTDDTEYIFEENAEPGMTGSLKTACSISDALVLQYYEENDPVKAAFGHKLSDEQWKEIAEIKDVYGDVLFTAPQVAVNVAHPLLKEIQSELNQKGRKFTFLCGHDSNIGSVLAALSAEDYALPDAIERKTPIGCKLVFARWTNKDGDAFLSADLVYQTVEQLRSMPLLNLENPPAIVPVVFRDLERNDDGLYPEAQMEERLQQAIEQYDELAEEYNQS